MWGGGRGGAVEPEVEKFEQFAGGLQPKMGFCLTPAGTNENTDATAFDGEESGFVGEIVAEVGDGDVGIHFTQESAKGVAFIAMTGANFDSTVEGQNIEVAVFCNQSPAE